MAIRAVFAFSILLWLSTSGLAAVIYADYRSWSFYSPNLPPSQLQLERFTHLSYGETMPNADGSLLHPYTHTDFLFIDLHLDGDVQKASSPTALSHLQQSHPQLQLLLQIAGDGSDKNWVAAKISARGSGHVPPE